MTHRFHNNAVPRSAKTKAMDKKGRIFILFVDCTDGVAVWVGAAPTGKGPNPQRKRAASTVQESQNRKKTRKDILDSEGELTINFNKISAQR
jgi:hypothetical protein